MTAMQFVAQMSEPRWCCFARHRYALDVHRAEMSNALATWLMAYAYNLIATSCLGFVLTLA